MDYEKLGLFYLGREIDAATNEKTDNLLLYDAKDLTTHAMCVGMTGSGKTGLCIDVLEEAAMDRIPAIVVDPKGDMTNLLLGFPEMKPEDFEPWVLEDEAQAKGITVQELAAEQAETWRSGLESWDIDPDRIRIMRETTDFAIYTPGSSAGRPISVLKLLNPPPAQVMEDSELVSEQVSGTASSLLSLIGIDVDPLQSREHILIANILHQSWANQENMDLAKLIAIIQNPPFTKVGVMELEDFFPQKDRFALALRFNNLLASPQFSNWLEGESLDISNLLYTKDGKPRLSILSISHLDDNERMFFVSLLLNQLVSWVRSQPGTSSLRALFYMDEIFGYFPPVANPPSKQPLLTLLKQARAYGLGIMLTTQNPVDLDYKGLANMGTWFIGRLQTERDKARLLDGLEGAAAATGSAFDRKNMDTLLSGLGKRVFLMNNVHDPEPTLFETRWAMSYLAGPLMRNQIRDLANIGKVDLAPEKQILPTEADTAADTEMPAVLPADTAEAKEETMPIEPPAETMPSTVSDGLTADGLLLASPVGPQGVPTYYLRADGGEILKPAIYALADIHFESKKNAISSSRSESWLTTLEEGLVNTEWAMRDDLEIKERDLKTKAPHSAKYLPLPEIAQKKTSFTQWERELKDTIYRQSRLELFEHKEAKMLSQLEESERDFKLRVEQTQREKRDEAVEKLRDKYKTRIARAEEKIRKQEQQLDRKAEMAKDGKRQTAISVGTTVLNALLGKKALSASTLGRATTAAKTSSRTSRQSSEVQRAEESLVAYQEELERLENELLEEVELIQKQYELDYDDIDIFELAAKKTDIRLRAFALVFLPEDLI